MRASLARRGLTLVELLMVVTIVVILTSVAIPLARVVNEDRKVREASRIVNAFLAGAQARAYERGRPVWVVLARENGNMCFKLALAETPPPYSGDVVNARAFYNSGSNTVTFGSGHANQLPQLVTAGDLIRFNYQGLYYPITTTPTGASLVITEPAGQSGAPAPPAAAGVGMAFQIFRKPTPSLASPVQMPRAVCIDLQVSGLGAGAAGVDGEFKGASATDASSVMFSFSPAGRLDQVQYQGGTSQATSSVCLLIGYVDKIGLGNLSNPKSIWVSINPTTGLVRTTDNVASSTIAASRQWATNSENLGGR